MGIKKLLTILDVIQCGHLEDLRGKTVGVDGYSWIHKSVYGVGHELVVLNDKNQLFKKMENKVEIFRKYNIKLVMVFDGDKLPSKEGTENLREERRNEKRLEATLLLQQGNTAGANRRFSESFDVTPQLAFEIMEYLKKNGLQIDCIVAPYEADAQLGYLSKINYIDAVIAEDSDMLVFGAKELFMKQDQNGNFEKIRLEDLGSVS